MYSMLKIMLVVYAIGVVGTGTYRLMMGLDPHSDEYNDESYLRSTLGITIFWPLFLIRAICRSVKVAWEKG